MYTATAVAGKPKNIGIRLAWSLLLLVEALLALRFVLKLSGAGPETWFAQAVYGLTAVVVAPFFQVIRSNQAAGSTFEYATLLAMFTCWLVVMASSVLFRQKHT